jgi:hypothetical protein
MITMKLRNATILLSLFFIAELIYLAVNNGNISLMQEPFSTLGNTNGNYLIFLISTALVLIGFMALTLKMYKLTNTKKDWELYAFPTIVIITLLTPYKHEFVSRTIHTILGVAAALIFILIIIKFNRNYSPPNKNLKKFSIAVPYLLFFGTLIAFLLTGLNSFIQILYLSILLPWINIVNFSLEDLNSSKKHSKITLLK